MTAASEGSKHRNRPHSAYQITTSTQRSCRFHALNRHVRCKVKLQCSVCATRLPLRWFNWWAQSRLASIHGNPTLFVVGVSKSELVTRRATIGFNANMLYSYTCHIVAVFLCAGEHFAFWSLILNNVLQCNVKV